MTALLYIARRAPLRRRRRRLDRAARAGPPDPGQALQRQGHPVLRRLRPHHLVASGRARPSTASRRSRSAATASSSGCSRRSPTRTRTRSARPAPACSPSWSATPARRSGSSSTRPTTTGCSTTSPGGSASSSWAPGWPSTWSSPSCSSSSSSCGYGVHKATTTVDTVSECVIAVTEANRDQPPARVHRQRPRRPGEGGRLPGRRPDRLLQRHPGDRAGSRSSTRSAPTAPRPPPSSSSATASELTLRPSTVVSPRLDPDNPERITKVGFLGRRADHRSASARASATPSPRWPTAPGRPSRRSARCR